MVGCRQVPLTLYYRQPSNGVGPIHLTTSKNNSTADLGFGGGDSNLYRYAGNSPTNATDRAGRTSAGVATVSGGVIGGAVGFGVGGWTGMDAEGEWQFSLDRAVAGAAVGAGIGATFDTWGGVALAGGILIGAGMGAAGGGGLFGRGNVNWEGFVHGAVIGGVSGAVGGGAASVFSGVFGGSLAGMAATGLVSGLVSNVASQATANVLGVQSGWDWQQFWVAGFSGLLGGALSGGLTRGMMRDGQVICGTSPTKWYTLSVTGEVLGNAVGDGLDQWVRLWNTEAEWDWGATARSVGMGLIMGLASAHTQWKYNKACFSGDTPLLTPDGSRRIDEIKVGDLVLSRDEHDLFGVVAPRAVEEVFVRLGRIMHLHVGGQVVPDRILVAVVAKLTL